MWSVQLQKERLEKRAITFFKNGNVGHIFKSDQAVRLAMSPRDPWSQIALRQGDHCLAPHRNSWHSPGLWVAEVDASLPWLLRFTGCYSSQLRVRGELGKWAEWLPAITDVKAVSSPTSHDPCPSSRPLSSPFPSLLPFVPAFSELCQAPLCVKDTRLHTAQGLLLRPSQCGGWFRKTKWQCDPGMRAARVLSQSRMHGQTPWHEAGDTGHGSIVTDFEFHVKETTICTEGNGEPRRFLTELSSWHCLLRIFKKHSFQVNSHEESLPCTIWKYVMCLDIEDSYLYCVLKMW